MQVNEISQTYLEYDQMRLKMVIGNVERALQELEKISNTLKVLAPTLPESQAIPETSLLRRELEQAKEHMAGLRVGNLPRNRRLAAVERSFALTNVGSYFKSNAGSYLDILQVIHDEKEVTATSLRNFLEMRRGYGGGREKYYLGKLRAAELIEVAEGQSTKRSCSTRFQLSASALEIFSAVNDEPEALERTA